MNPQRMMAEAPVLVEESLADSVLGPVRRCRCGASAH